MSITTWIQNMSNQQNPPRNNPDAEATEKGWRHPQTGELLVSVKGLDTKKKEETKLPEPVEGPTETVVGELDVVTSSLNGSTPLSVTITIKNPTDLVGGSVHWGDGSEDTEITDPSGTVIQKVEFTHTYVNVGECTLKVTGSFKDGTSNTVTKLVKIKKAPAPKKEATTEAK